MRTHELARFLLAGPDEMVLFPLGPDHEGVNYGNHSELQGFEVYRADVSLSVEGYYQLSHENGVPATIIGEI